MKAQIISDHHLEFRDGMPDELFKELGMKNGLAEIGIVAGDYMPYALSHKAWIADFAKLADHYEKLIYVPGNHDYYGCTSKNDLDIAFAALQHYIPNISVLSPENPFCTFKGQRFVGSTMWFLDSMKLRRAWNLISDTSQIPDINWVFAHCQRFDQILKENLNENDIVVTHHLPTEQATPKRWRRSLTQPFFVHDQERIIIEIQPKMWIFGHTHTGCDFNIGKTRLFCNPVGYPYENRDVKSCGARSIIEI